MKKITLILIFYLAGITSSQWTTEVTYLNRSLEYVTVLDSSVAWAVGHISGYPDSSLLLRRTDFSNWIELFLGLGASNDFTCVAAQDSDKVWLGTANGKVYYFSYNNNQTVLQIDIGGQGYINDIKFSRTNKNYGYVYSDPPEGPGTAFKIYKTSNAGMNWTEISPVFGGPWIGALSMCVTDSAHVWIGLNCQSTNCQSPRIAFTTNGGFNWALSAIPNNSNYISAIAFKNDNSNGIVVPWDHPPTYFFKSLNGGISWTLLYNTQYPLFVNGLCWASGSNTWYFSSNEEFFDQIIKSTDDGLSWDAMHVPEGTDQVQSMDIARSGNYIYGWAVTLNGRILRLVDSVSVIGIHNIESEIPTEYYLYQNYPNPFNPSTTIQYSIPKAGNVKLVIYDINGREVTTLLNKYSQPGTFEVNWDAENQSTGVYFYKMITDGYTDIKRMILIK